MKAEWEVRFQGFVIDRTDHGTEPAPPAALEAFLDDVGQELEKLDADNVLIETTLSLGAIEVTLTVDALEPQEAVVSGSSLLRTAFHAAGAETPGWSVDWVEVNAEKAGPDEDGDRPAKRELVDA